MTSANQAVAPISNAAVSDVAVPDVAISAGDSVTQWIVDLKQGRPDAAERLWQRYFSQLVTLARSRLLAGRRAAADEEDVALSAFNSLCFGAAGGRFPQLCDRENLWPLLVVLTVRKAQDQARRRGRKKRGGGVKIESLDSGAVDWQVLLSHEPTPDLAVMLAESCDHLLGKLDDSLRAIAQLRLEGFSTAEIAQKQRCGLRTVERRLELIRRTWADVVD